MSKSLEMLKEKINNCKTVEDEILAIFVGSNEDRISTDRAMIHSAFHEMKNKCRLLQIKDIIFDLSPIFPYSEELESALFRLEASEVLQYYFCDDPYYIMEGIRSESCFNGEEQKEVSECASILQKRQKSLKARQL